MPHQDVMLNGRREPSVTEFTGIFGKGDWLAKWYGKHSLTKVYAVLGSLGIAHKDVVLDKKQLDVYHLDVDDFWMDAEALKTRAQERGVALHGVFEKAAEALMTGGPLPDDPFVAALVKWLGIKQFRFLAYEKFVTSTEHRFGGTFDALCASPTGEVVVDWKFTKRLKVENVLQLASYDLALGGPSRAGVVLRIDEAARPAKVDSLKPTAAGVIYKFAGSKVVLEEHSVPDLGKFHPLVLSCRSIFEFMQTYRC